MGKLSYLQRSLSVQFTSGRFICPNCGCAKNRVIERKFFITQLRRCADCDLLFRTPTDDPLANTDYYESEYSQGFTTQLPSDEALSQLLQTNFRGTEKDYSYYVDVLFQLGMKPGSRIFDYGCSWGYGSYQLSKAGFDVLSYEVARGRRTYASKKLGVQVVDDMSEGIEENAGQFDGFFSSHVIEHVPCPAQSFEYALRLLKQGGLFVAFVPNGSEAFKRASPDWSHLWGEVHPNFIDDIFLDHSFKNSPRAIGSSPVKNARIPDASHMLPLDTLERSELFFAARKEQESWA